MRVLLGVLLLSLLPACGSAAAEDRMPEPVEAWSFNLRYASADDGENSWPQRAAYVRELLAEADPDLLGVQEAQPVQIAALREALPGHGYWGRSRVPNPGGEQCGVWWKESRFRFVEGGHFWLSPTPGVEASRGWDAALPRMASWVILEDRAEGGEILVCGTHFDHRGGEARLQSARLLADKLPRLAEGRPMVLLGDFNADGGSEPWTALAGEGAPFRDTWPTWPLDAGQLEVIEMPPPPELRGSFHGFRGVPDGRRIDWVLVSPDWLIEVGEVLHPRRDGRAPSDHEPVRAVLLPDFPAAR